MGDIDHESPNEATVHALLDEWAAAYARRDADGVATLYSDDALFLGSTPELRRGQTGVRAYFSALPPILSSVAFSDIVVKRIDHQVMQAAMIATFSAGAHQLAVRLTQVYARREKVWKIVQHHASPADAFKRD